MDNRTVNQGNQENSHSSRGRTFRGSQSPRNSTVAKSESSVPNQKTASTSSTNDTSTTARNVNKSNERSRTNHAIEVDGEEDNSWGVSNAHRKRGQNREYRQGYRQFEPSEQGGSRHMHSSGTADNRVRPPRGGIGRGTSRGRYDKRRGFVPDHRRGRDSNLYRSEMQPNTARKPAGPCYPENEQDNIWNEKAKSGKDVALLKSLEKDDLKGITPESKEQEDEMLQLAMRLSLQENQHQGLGEFTSGRKCAATPDIDLHFDEGEKVNQVLLQPTEFPPLPSSSAGISSQATSPALSLPACHPSIQPQVPVKVSVSLPACHPSIQPQVPVKVSGSVDSNSVLSLTAKKNGTGDKSVEDWDKLGARPKTQPLMTSAQTASSRGIGRGAAGGGRGRPNSSSTDGDIAPKIGELVTASPKSTSADAVSEMPWTDPDPSASQDLENLPAVGNGQFVAAVTAESSKSVDAVPLSVLANTHTRKTNDPNVILLARNKCDDPFEDESHFRVTESVPCDTQVIVERTVDLPGIAAQPNDAVLLTVTDSKVLLDSNDNLYTANCDLGLETLTVEPRALPPETGDSFPVLDEVQLCKNDQSIPDDLSVECSTDASCATSENYVQESVVSEAPASIESQSSNVVAEVQWTETSNDDKDEIIARLCKKIEMLQKQGPSSDSATSALQAPYPAYPIPVPFYPFPVAVPFSFVSNGSTHVANGGLHESTYQQLPMVPMSTPEMSSANLELSSTDVMLQHTGSLLSPNAAEFVPQDHSMPNFDHRRRDAVECYESREGRGRGPRGYVRPYRKNYGQGYRQQSTVQHYNLGVHTWMPPASGMDHSFPNYVPAGYSAVYPTSAAGYRPGSNTASPNNQYPRMFHRNGGYPGSNHYGYY